MKLRKLLSIVLTLAMVASTFTAFAINASAAVVSGGDSVKVSYDLTGKYPSSLADNVVNHSRTYQEYKTGDDVSALGAYTAHNMVFDGGLADNQMTYLSPNPLDYWPGNTKDNGCALDYGGMGWTRIDTQDISYIAYEVTSDSPISSLFVKLHGCLAPSLDQGGNGGWAQMAVYAFAALPTDANGRIAFENYQAAMGTVATNVVGDMHAVHDFYQTPETFDLTESVTTLGNPTKVYVVVACLASGGILEKVDDRLSGYGGQNGAPVFRLTGVDIATTSGTNVGTLVYVAPNGDDANDGSQAAPVKTITKAAEIAAANLPSQIVVDPSMLTLTAANKYGTAVSGMSNATVKQYLPGVVFWGDSLTAGTGGTGYDGSSAWNPYPTAFGKYIQSNLLSDFAAANRPNYGVGGENAGTIAGRANASPVVLTTGITIPASGSVTVSMKLKETSDSFSPLKQTTGVDALADTTQPVTINGIAGNLTLSGGTYTFTRTGSGSATSVAANTQVVFTNGNKYDNTNYIPVVFIGYNDGAQYIAQATTRLTNYIDAILNKYPAYKNNGRYVVVAPHFKKDQVANVKTIEAALEGKYGNHLIKTREFMSTYGPFEMGLTPDPVDITMMANGQVPNCLMSTDDTHYSNSGYELVARLVYQKMYDLGYFNEVITALGIDTSTWGTITTPPSGGGTGGTVTPSTPTTAGKYYAQPSETAKLSFKYNYDNLDLGGRGIPACVKDEYLFLTNDNASTAGAELAHNLFVDGQDGGGKMTYIHPGSYEAYDATYMESGNAIEADFIYSSSTINAGYDFSYLAYRVSAGSGKSIDTLNLNLYGAIWPSVITGARTDCRYQMAVYVSNFYTTDASGRVDFGELDSYKVFAIGDTSAATSWYKDSDCKKIDCSAALNKLGNVGDVYVFVVLSCVGWGVGPDETGSRWSTYDTTTSLRYTGIAATATAKNVAPDAVPANPSEGGGTTDPGHTHSMTLVPAVDATCSANGNIEYYSCSGCGKYFSDAAGNTEITLDSTVTTATHNYTWTGVPAGHVGICASCGTQSSLEAHTPNIPAPTTASAQYCTVCNYKMADQLQGHAHTMVTIPAVAATCTAAGNITYYVCSGCAKYFSDAAGTAEITLAQTTVAAKGHTPNISAATATQDKVCTVCGIVLENKTGTVTPPTTEFKGDFNVDGTITAADADYLASYLLMPSYYPIPTGVNCDLNSDGVSNTLDSQHLVMNILLPSLYPLYPAK